MPSCVFCGRSENAVAKSANITFHRFPKRENIRQLWKNFFKISREDDGKHIRNLSIACSLHFDKYCFLQNKCRRLLKKNAIPTIVIERIKNAKIVYPERHTITVSQNNSDTENSACKNILHFKRTLVQANNIEVKGVFPFDDMRNVTGTISGSESVETSTTMSNNIEV